MIREEDAELLRAHERTGQRLRGPPVIGSALAVGKTIPGSRAPAPFLMMSSASQMQQADIPDTSHRILDVRCW